MAKSTTINMGNITVKGTGLKNSASMRDVLLGAFKVETSINEAKLASGGLSEHVFNLAKKFVDCDSFLKSIAFEESFFKSQQGQAYLTKHGVQFEISDKTGLVKIPRCWSQYKSNIKQGWEKYGLNPVDYDSESAYRKALNEARKAAKGDNQEESGNESEGDSVTAKQIPAGIAELLVKVADTYESASDDQKAEMELALEMMVEFHSKEQAA